MAETITFGIQKGGAAKTTTAAVTAYLLSLQGFKVLCVDLDSQGHLTELLTFKRISEYRQEGIKGALDAIKESDARNYILALNEKMHLLPSDEILGTIDSWLVSKDNTGEVSDAVKRMLVPVQGYYDYIIIDTPPELGYILTNALTASDEVVTLFEGSSFGQSALNSFFGTVDAVKSSTNPRLQIIGILCSMMDLRRNDHKDFLQLLKKEEPFKNLCFKTIIKRRAATGRLPIGGIFNNPEIRQATKQFQPYVEELIKRCKRKIAR